MGPLLLISLSLPLQSPAPGDRWFGADKAKHFMSGVFVQSVGYGTIRVAGGSNSVALTGATLGTVAVAVWKERRDRSAGATPSFRDVTWTMAGGATASLVLAQSRR